MANICDVDMTIMGGKTEVEHLVSLLSHSDLGRVYDCYVCETGMTETQGVYFAYCGVNCAWSILGSMRAKGGFDPSLESLSRQLGLSIEAYSSEPGFCFQEHVLIVNGECIVEECVDYQEHFVDSVEKLDEYNAEYGTNFTPDMVNHNGDVCIGGFGDEYGNFKSCLEIMDIYRHRVAESVSDFFAECIGAPNYREIRSNVIENCYVSLTNKDPVKALMMIEAIEKHCFGEDNCERAEALIENIKWCAVSKNKIVKKEVAVVENTATKDAVSVDDSLVNLWGRLGVSLDVTKEELEVLLGDDKVESEKVFVDLLMSDRCSVCGDTYFPDEANEDVLKDAADELAFELNGRPLHEGFVRVSESSGVGEIDRENTVSIWGRLGISLDVTKEEFDVLLGNDKAAGEKAFVTLLMSDRCSLCGDTYFPDEANEEILGGREELSFDLVKRPLHEGFMKKEYGLQELGSVVAKAKAKVVEPARGENVCNRDKDLDF